MPTTVMSRFSYPKVPGDTPWSIIDVTGPASYVKVTAGAGTTPPSGGQRITAADFGLQSLDWIGAMSSGNANFSVLVTPLGFFKGDIFTSILLRWTTMTDVTGTMWAQEVAAGTNLSQATVRLLAIGR